MASVEISEAKVLISNNLGVRSIMMNTKYTNEREKMFENIENIEI